MIKALWAVAVISALALGISIFGTVVDRSSVQTQSVKVSALMHEVAKDRKDLAQLHAEVHVLTVTRHGPP